MGDKNREYFEPARKQTKKKNHESRIYALEQWMLQAGKAMENKTRPSNLVHKDYHEQALEAERRKTKEAIGRVEDTEGRIYMLEQWMLRIVKSNGGCQICGAEEPVSIEAEVFGKPVAVCHDCYSVIAGIDIEEIPNESQTKPLLDDAWKIIAYGATMTEEVRRKLSNAWLTSYYDHIGKEVK